MSHRLTDWCNACREIGCLGCREHPGDKASMEARRVDDVYLTVCKAAGPCIQRAKAAGIWEGTR